MDNTNAFQNFSVKNKPVIYIVIFATITIIIGLYMLFSSINKDNNDLSKKVAKQSEIVSTQSQLITNLNQKNYELTGILTSYDAKLGILYTNLFELQTITEKLKTSSDEKDVKIKDLSQEKSALESDLKSLRNTLGKMTKEIVELSDELKSAKTEKDQSDLITQIASLTKERDFLKTKVTEYEKIIDALKKENANLALNMRQNLKKTGYEFKTKLGEWPKGAEVLMKISQQNMQKILEEINETKPESTEEKQESPKKVGFLKRLFGSSTN
jgi:hypothetical protein